MLQLRYRMHKLFDVAPESFDPPPRVVSAIVRMIPLGPERMQPLDAEFFEKVVQRAFSQRRKMLRGVMGDWAGVIAWDALGIDPTWRAEQVSPAAFVGLADALFRAGIR